MIHFPPSSEEREKLRAILEWILAGLCVGSFVAYLFQSYAIKKSLNLYGEIFEKVVRILSN